MKYLKILILVASLISSVNIFSQEKMPTIMILPSDNWCEQRFFMTSYNDMGALKKVPNYKQAFQEDTELSQVISKIGSLMIERGFYLKDVESEVKILENQKAEDNLTESKNGSLLSETPLDMLKKTAKADILIQIWWKVNKQANGNSVSFTLEALDSYTGKRIASSTGNSQVSQDIVPEILLKETQNHIEPFTKQLKKYFKDLIKNGREVTLYMKKWDSWEYDFEKEYNNKELIDIIDDWMNNNTVNGRYNLSNSSENYIKFDQVRIPVYDENGRAIDARMFANRLRSYFKKSPYNFEIKVITKGLGEAVLIFGEK